MLFIHATDRKSQVRKNWPADFRNPTTGTAGLCLAEIASEIGNIRMSGVTDCVWIAPGTIDVDVA
jgi:hypothetical protein